MIVTVTCQCGTEIQSGEPTDPSPVMRVCPDCNTVDKGNPYLERALEALAKYATEGGHYRVAITSD